MEWRAVEDEEVPACLEALEDGGHPLRAEQLRRVRRQRTRREDPEAVLLGGLGDRIETHAVTAKQGREPVGIRQVEHDMGAGLAQVRVDEEDPTTRLSEDDGQVGCRDGLAFARHRARDHQGSDGRVDGSEFDVGSKRPIGLGDAGAGIEEGGQPVHLVPVLGALHERDRAQGVQAERPPRPGRVP